MSTNGVTSRVVHFTRRLREAGLSVGIDGTQRFARALELVDTTSASEVYHTGRATLVFRREDLAIFDRIFRELWLHDRSAKQRQKMPVAPRHDPNRVARTALVSFLSERASPDAEEIDVADRTGAASWAEQLVRKDFARMSPDELEAVKRALLHAHWSVLWRRTRRRTPDRRGDQLDLRALLRRSARRSGVLVELPKRRRKHKQRPLVLIADVSGSMELYSRVLLQFFHGLSQNLCDVESFVFGTRLTRITAALRLRDVDWALDAVTDEVVDFAGGTRIGESLRTFDRKWRPRVLGRGAVVVVVSDGLETRDHDLLEQQVERLHARSHRLIWLNPLLGGTAYEPRAEGMARALRHVDAFLPSHNLQSLRGLAGHLATLGDARRPALPARALRRKDGGDQ